MSRTAVPTRQRESVRRQLTPRSCAIRDVRSVKTHKHTMTFLQFPPQLTEEEQLLQQKYQKLKRKVTIKTISSQCVEVFRFPVRQKKQVQSLKAPKVEPAPPPPPVKRGNAACSGDLSHMLWLTGIDVGPKADAKEVAKKLLKSGAISAIKVPEKKDAGFMRKRVSLDRSIDRPGGYQPFSASTSVEGEPLEESFGAPADPNPAPNLRPEKYNLYSNFVSAKDVESIAREETLRERKREGKAHYVNRDLPNQGNTVYVRGHGLTEPSLRSEFSMCGSIVQITIESEKNCAFVTFESIEEANKAIDALNNTTIDNVQVQVSLARKQPVIKNQHSAAASDTVVANSNSWTTIAANFYKESRDTGKKDNTRTKRQAIVYDDIVE